MILFKKVLVVLAFFAPLCAAGWFGLTADVGLVAKGVVGWGSLFAAPAASLWSSWAFGFRG